MKITLKMKVIVHVKPMRNGKWKVKSSNARRAYRIVATQAEAIGIGRRIAMNKACELYVHRTDGTLRSKDSFGSDPFPPRSK